MLLELFRGNLPEAVAKAKQDGRLTDWLLALSPVATTQAWRELCEAYAKQLSKDQMYHQAASYLLAANKVRNESDGVSIVLWIEFRYDVIPRVFGAFKSS